MSIKRLFFLFVLLLTVSISGFAQAQIEGFWGVKFGDSERNVVSKVRQSYPNADYKRDTKGHPFTASQVSLAGLDVDACEFTFKNGIFTKAQFVKSAGGKFVYASNAQSFVNSLMPQMQSDYQDFCEAISQKYGTPRVSGQTATWRTSNGNSITVKPWTNISSYIMYHGTT